MPRHLEEIDPLEEKLRGATPKEEEDRTVEEALLAHLDPAIERHLITEVLRPIKTGKEAVVYCCLAHPTLERDLVAAKVYRPFETRSFKQDAIYQQGRERGSRPDARVLRALGKKTRRGRLHKFSAWIAHEERTLRILHDAGADVPEPIERVGPVVLMEYLGDEENPAPMMTNVELEESEARRTYARVLKNVDLFLTSAGVSVGDFDMVKNVLAAEGEMHFWQVAIKPGKPLAFGSVGDVPLLGLLC